MHNIELAGKVLSQSNSDRLKAAFVEIGKTLIAAGAISTSDLSNLFEGVAENLEGESTLEAGAAMSLRERYKREIVFSNFRHLLSHLEFICSRLLRNPQNTADRVGTIVADFKDTFNEILKEASALDPIPDDLEMMHRDGLYCAKTEDPSELSASQLVESASQLVDVELHFGLEDPLILEKAIEINSDEFVETVEAASPNQNVTPLKGVLFKIGEPSESAPSKGSDYPLLIPMNVAEKAMEFVNAAKGLPLDADDSLSKHANEDIIGIMTSAEIDASDFVVKGHLFPWNRKDKVDAIALNQDNLGMSLNGKASGKIVEMNGSKVFELSKLEILGANILLKNRATYQKTRIYPLGEIAASAPNELENQSTEGVKPNMELERAIGELQKTLGEIRADSARESEAAKARIQQLTETVSAQQQLLQTIQAERDQSIAAAQSQTLAAQKAQEHQELIAAIGTAVQSQVQAQVGSLKEEIIDSINPKRVPPRQTGSLVNITASGQENQQSNAVRDRLLVLSGELKALGEDQATNPRRIALLDEAHRLNQQLSVT
jgi:hypothetical protein